MKIYVYSFTTIFVPWCMAAVLVMQQHCHHSHTNQTSSNVSDIYCTLAVGPSLNDSRRKGSDADRGDELASKLPNVKVGPKRTKDYDPNWGYEPYWAGGEWVSDTIKLNGSMCGAECNIMFIKQGWICGRNNHYHHKSFKNFCVMKNEDCDKSKGGTWTSYSFNSHVLLLLHCWRLAYLGKCKITFKTNPTHFANLLIEAKKLQSEFFKKLPTTKNVTSTKKPSKYKNDLFNMNGVQKCQGSKTTLTNWSHIYEKNKTTVRGRHYDPNHGYQWYWPGGQWLIYGDTRGTQKTTTQLPLVCGNQCPSMYAGIKEVCTRETTHTNMYVCRYCDGQDTSDYNTGHRTFSNYCTFLASECHESQYSYVRRRAFPRPKNYFLPYQPKYTLVYLGKCIKDFKEEYLKPVREGNHDAATRKEKYIKALEALFKKHKLGTPCNKKK